MGQFCAGFFSRFQAEVGLGDLSWGPLPTWAILWCCYKCHSRIFIAFCLQFYICSIFTGHYLLFVRFFGLNSVQGSKAHAVLSIRYSDFKACDEKGTSFHSLFFLCCCSCKMIRGVSRPATWGTSREAVGVCASGPLYPPSLVRQHSGGSARGTSDVVGQHLCITLYISFFSKCDAAPVHIFITHQLEIEFLIFLQSCRHLRFVCVPFPLSKIFEDFSFFHLQLICINSWWRKYPQCPHKYPPVLNNSKLQCAWYSETSPCEQATYSGS